MDVAPYKYTYKLVFDLPEWLYIKFHIFYIFSDMHQKQFMKIVVNFELFK